MCGGRGGGPIESIWVKLYIVAMDMDMAVAAVVAVAAAAAALCVSVHPVGLSRRFGREGRQTPLEAVFDASVSERLDGHDDEMQEAR